MVRIVSITMSQYQSKTQIEVKEFANEKVLIQSAIIGIIDQPEIIEGEVSDNGEYIHIETSYGKSYKLPTDRIMMGETYFPNNRSLGFKLYNKSRFKKARESELIQDQNSYEKDLPEETHKPV